MSTLNTPQYSLIKHQNYSILQRDKVYNELWRDSETQKLQQKIVFLSFFLSFLSLRQADKPVDNKVN
jgi:hypothetical protein